MQRRTFIKTHAAPEVIHELVKWWQYEHGGSMRGLAKALGTTPASIYYWGREGMPFRNSKKIVELTNGVFSIERLFPQSCQK